jgi:hypothetical protein
VFPLAPLEAQISSPTLPPLDLPLPSSAAADAGRGGSGPFVPNVLGGGRGDFFDGATRAGSLGMLVGSGRGGVPWPGGGCSRTLLSSAIADDGGWPRSRVPPRPAVLMAARWDLGRRADRQTGCSLREHKEGDGIGADR